VQPIVHLRQERVGREDIAAGCGQFDRQRQSVQPPAQGSHRCGIALRQGECRTHPPGALDEELHGVVLFNKRTGGRLCGQGQGLDREALLAVEMERSATRGQHLHGRTPGKQCSDEVGRVCQHMFAVVQQQ
jgi:hypothetical protein